MVRGQKSSISTTIMALHFDKTNDFIREEKIKRLNTTGKSYLQNALKSINEGAHAGTNFA